MTDTVTTNAVSGASALVEKVPLETYVPPAKPSLIGLSRAEIADRLGDRVRYAFPPPPGWQVGQPWFIPKCGITKAVVNPSRDPETER